MVTYGNSQKLCIAEEAHHMLTLKVEDMYDLISIIKLWYCSYLGFGLMAGRAAVLAWEETQQANPCIPRDHSGVYEYGGLSYDLVSAPSGASFESCGRLVKLVLKQDLDCGAPAVRQACFAWAMLTHCKHSPTDKNLSPLKFRLFKCF